jgi:aldose 1-epimerase
MPLTHPTRVDGYDAIRLRSASAHLDATFVPIAGMVGASLRDGGEELLGRGLGVHCYARGGTTMGIPLLHPWANRLGAFTYEAAGRTATLDRGSRLVRTEEHDLPIHGLLTASPHWRVLEKGAAALSAELDFGAQPDLLAAFPFPHVLRLDVQLDDGGLTVRATVEPTTSQAVPIAFGFHPYLTLPGVPREQWEVALPVRRRLFLDDRALPTGESEPVEPARGRLGERTYDDAFADLVPDTPFAVAGGGRELTVWFLEGYPYAQVFAPPGTSLICFEPMTAPADALRTGEGLRLATEPFTAAFRIGVDAAG